MGWSDITRSDEFQSLRPDEQQAIKVAYYTKQVAPLAQEAGLPENEQEAVFQAWMQKPDDSGQSYFTGLLSSAGRGFASFVPGAVGGVGTLIGSEDLEQTGEDIEAGINEFLPVNPIHQDSMGMKIAGAGGQALSMIATGGVGGATAKVLAGTKAIRAGAETAALGSGFLSGVRQGGQEAERYGMTGGTAYARALGGGLTELATEKLLFGLGSETAAARKMLGDTLEKGTGAFGKAVGTEAGEEAVAQVAGNIQTKLLAPEGVQTPGIMEGMGEAALLGGVGGAVFGGINALAGANTIESGEIPVPEELRGKPKALRTVTIPGVGEVQYDARSIPPSQIMGFSPDEIRSYAADGTGLITITKPETPSPDPVERAVQEAEANVQAAAPIAPQMAAAVAEGAQEPASEVSIDTEVIAEPPLPPAESPPLEGQDYDLTPPPETVPPPADETAPQEVAAPAEQPVSAEQTVAAETEEEVGGVGAVAPELLTKEGTPRVFHHGTRETFDSPLRAGEASKRGLHTDAIWFAPNEGKDSDSSTVSEARRYSGDYGSIISATLDIRRPYYGSVDDVASDRISAEWLRANGYDGFIDNLTGSGLVAVLDASQVKEVARKKLKEPAPAVIAPEVPVEAAEGVVAPDVAGLNEAEAKTPMMKEWVRARKTLPPNAVLLVRLGDFFEAFANDAESLNKATQATLTKRSGIRMAGIPYHSIDNAMEALKVAGFLPVQSQLEGGKLQLPSTEEAKSQPTTTKVIYDAATLSPEIFSDRHGKTGSYNSFITDEASNAVYDEIGIPNEQRVPRKLASAVLAYGDRAAPPGSPWIAEWTKLFRGRVKAIEDATHVKAIEIGLRDNQSVSAAAVEQYGITLPEGYVREGDLYVFREQPAAESPVAETAQNQVEVHALKGGKVTKTKIAPSKENLIQLRKLAKTYENVLDCLHS